MREQMKLLQELQRLDSGIAEMRLRLRGLEGDLQRSRAEEALIAEALQREKAKLTETQRRRRAAEQEVKVWSDRQQHQQKQLGGIRNNDEYQALLREIATAKEKIRGFEDEVLAAMEEEEASQAGLGRLETEGREKQRVSVADRARIEEQKAAADQRIGELSRARESALAALRTPIRSRYERLRTAMGEGVIAVVAGGACGGCHFRLPPQVVNLVRRADDLVTCESCGRMLVSAREGEADPR